jgi:hypothetical protein
MVDEEDAAEAASELDEKDLDEVGGGRWADVYSYAYLTALALGLLGAAYGIYRLARAGVIESDISVSVNANIGWVVEWFLAAILLIVVFWTVLQVVNAAGIGFINSLKNVIAEAADGYEKDRGGDNQ